MRCFGTKLKIILPFVALSHCATPLFDSDIAGMLAIVSVGSPPQEMELRVDFFGDITRLVAPGERNPFTRGFSSDDSESFEPISQEIVIEPGTFGAAYTVGSDVMSVGSSPPMRTSFKFISKMNQFDLLQRDTAGKLALSPKSEIGQSSTFAVTSLNLHDPITGKTSAGLGLEINPSAIPSAPSSKIVSLALSERTPNAWGISGRLVLNQNDMFGKLVPIVFVPTRKELSIPEKLLPSVLEAFELISEDVFVDPKRRLMLPCGSDERIRIPVKLSVKVQTGETIPIPLKMDVGNRVFVQSKRQFMCETEILFLPAQSDIVIGSQVMRGLDALVFDGPNRHIHFHVVSASGSRDIPTVEAPYSITLPSYLDYFVTREEDLVRIRFPATPLTHRTGRAYGLTSIQPDTLGTNKLLYAFYPFRSQADSSPSFHIIPGIFHLVGNGEVEIDPDTLSLSIALIPAYSPERKSYEVSIEQKQTGLYVRLAPVNAVAAFEDLAIEECQDIPSDDPTCCICLEDFTFEDLPVKTSCNHFYHKDCLRAWSSKENLHCPTCRTPSRLRAGAQLRKAGDI